MFELIAYVNTGVIKKLLSGPFSVSAVRNQRICISIIYAGEAGINNQPMRMDF